jgi:predicted RND superfamily exporter protein
VRVTVTGVAAMTLLFIFGNMGFLDIPLNVATAIVSSVAIGIGVDYLIFFISWYRNELRKAPDIDAALENSIVHMGRAILYNMFVIFGGFVVLTASQFVPLIQFGALVAACMIITALGALVLVPAIIRDAARKERDFVRMGAKRIT